MAEAPSGTVTFLFTDIEGSTRLWERSQERMQSVLAQHDVLLREGIERQGGYVFKTVGDAFCAAFPAAPEALAAALSAQRALAREEALAALRVRMALHTGAAEERGGDFFGPPLNRVARLLAAGHGGQVLLSRATQELVRDSLPAGAFLRDLGEHRLRDLTRPEHIFQLTAPELPSEFPPLRTLELRLHNLPLQPTPLIGREKEVHEVTERLRRSEVRLLTLTGPGGTGKTRLALQAAAELVEEFEDGVFFVNLAPLTDPELVPSSIAQVLGVRETGGRSLPERLHEHLRERRMLLVLDNFEQVVEAAPVVTALLAAAPRLKVLVTSRTALHLRGEKGYVVPPLSLPDPKQLPPLERLGQYEAVRLFIERALDVRGDFAVTDENAPAVAEICHRLDGLPLAIELAAARIRILSPEALLRRLENRLKLLTGGARDLPERQRTLQATIGWSHDLLSEAEKVLFRRLPVFTGGRTLEAIETVCDAEGELGLDVLEGVTSLVDKSLLRQEEGIGGEPRLVMLETIHEYAREKLEESGEGQEIRRRHAEFFLALAEEVEPHLHGREAAEWLERLEQEHENFRAALEWSFKTRQFESALRLSAALAWFWWVRGYLREGDRWLRRGLAESHDIGSVPPLVRAKVLRAGRMMTLHIGDHSRTKSLAEEGLALAREMGDQESIAHALGDLATMAHADGDVRRATALYEEALATLGEADLQDASATILYNLALLLSKQGNYQRASSLLTTALAICEAAGDKTRMGWMYRAQGAVALHQGDYEQAARLFRQSLSLLWQVGEKLGIAEAFELLASVAAERQDDPASVQRAARLFGAAELLREEISAPVEVPDAAEYDRRITRVRSFLGEPVFAATWAEGRTMSLEQAVGYALEEEG